jgi:hypothetical protein
MATLHALWQFAANSGARADAEEEEGERRADGEEASASSSPLPPRAPRLGLMRAARRVLGRDEEDTSCANSQRRQRAWCSLCCTVLTIPVQILFVATLLHALNAGERKPAWDTFAEYTVHTPPCAPLRAGDDASEHALRLQPEAPLTSSADWETAFFGQRSHLRDLWAYVRGSDSGHWTRHLSCADFWNQSAPAACACMLRRRVRDPAHVLCSPAIVGCRGPFTRQTDNWLRDLPPAVVPAKVVVRDACHEKLLEFEGDDAFLVVRALNFLHRSPLSELFCDM